MSVAVAADDPRIELFGFARLVGEGLDYVIKKYDVVLGRASKSGQTDVVLGDNMNISRQHARIVYNSGTRAFELVVLGKNGVTVGTTLYTPASQPYALKSQDMLAVGDKIFYFLLPKSTDRITKRDLELLSPNHPANKRPKLASPAAATGAPLMPGALALGGGGGSASGGVGAPLLAGAMQSRGPPGMPPGAQLGLMNAAAAAAAAQGLRAPGLAPLLSAGSSGQQGFLLQPQQQQAAMQHALNLAAAGPGAAVNGALGAGPQPPLG